VKTIQCFPWQLTKLKICVCPPFKQLKKRHFVWDDCWRFLQRTLHRFKTKTHFLRVQKCCVKTYFSCYVMQWHFKHSSKVTLCNLIVSMQLGVPWSKTIPLISLSPFFFCSRPWKWDIVLFPKCRRKEKKINECWCVCYSLNLFLDSLFW